MAVRDNVLRENTARRLKEVLDIMAAGSRAGEKPNGGAVLAEAVKRVPFTDEEAGLLSGGIPRGHKNLTQATAKLVKAGWMEKGRSGWTITEAGLRATVAFHDAAALTAALEAGTPVPAQTALPETDSAAEAAETAAKPAAKKAPAKKAAAKSATKDAGSAQEAASAPAEQGASGQPESVALPGDFGEASGIAPWDPADEKVQMRFESAEGKWVLTLDLPAGSYSYKAVLNGSWEDNYGAFGVRDGSNHEFSHDGGPVTFRYDHTSRDVLQG